jgi:hypothetical protein
MATSGIEKAKSACMSCTMSLGLLMLVASLGPAKCITKIVPRAALLVAVLAGVALVYIAANFTVQNFSNAHSAMAPFIIFLIGFASENECRMGFLSLV